jgi:hypothetical protein
MESFLTSQQVLSSSRVSPHFMKPRGSLPHSQEPATCPYPVPDRFSTCAPPTFRKSILIISSHLRVGLPSGSFPQVFPLKPCLTLYSPPYVLHAPPTSVFFILSPKLYLVRTTEHKAPCYVVFSTPPPPASCLLRPNVLLSTLFSKTLSLHSSLNVSDQVSHPYKTTGTIMFSIY